MLNKKSKLYKLLLYPTAIMNKKGLTPLLWVMLIVLIVLVIWLVMKRLGA